jgi:prevent-host-death family protein
MYGTMYAGKMKIPKVQSATELRSNLFETLREVQEGEPQLITHTKGSDGVIMISQARLNAILEENDVLKSIAKGRADVAAGRTYDLDEMKTQLSRMHAQWRKQK